MDIRRRDATTTAGTNVGVLQGVYGFALHMGVRRRARRFLALDAHGTQPTERSRPAPALLMSRALRSRPPLRRPVAVFAPPAGARLVEQLADTARLHGQIDPHPVARRQLRWAGGRTVAATDSMAVSTLRDYVEVLKRRKWVVLLPLVLVPLAAVLLSLRQPALYEASAQVLISRENLATQLEGLTDSSTLDPARTAQTQAQLARVPEVARRALEAAKVERSPSDLLGASSVTQTPETDLLIFRVRDAAPDVAALLANAYARQFTNYRRELESDVLVRARARVQSAMEALEARGDRDSAAYDTLLEKDQQLLTMEALQTGRAVVVRDAAGATQIRPQPQRAASIGLVLALVLALALAFLYEALDSRAKSAQDVAARLRLPLLGRIPPPPRQVRKNKQLVMLSAPYSKHAEAFRMLRSNLEFGALDRGASRRAGRASDSGRVLMVTSAQAGEGKSTTIANLAIAFAHAGRRTILVDLDLRNSFLETLFGLEGKPGVTDVVSGDIRLDQALISVPSPQEHALSPVVGGMADDHLWVLPGSARNPADFGARLLGLGDPRLRGLPETLRTLSERAEIVLVDAPPLLVAGDAMALTAHVDGIVVVTRANLIRAATLDELRRVLDVAPAAKLGFILTGSKDVGGYYKADYGPAAGHSTSSQDPGNDVDGQWNTEEWNTEDAAIPRVPRRNPQP
jgi:polysaccharide biosynthesis transport protein